MSVYGHWTSPKKGIVKTIEYLTHSENRMARCVNSKIFLEKKTCGG